MTGTTESASRTWSSSTGFVLAAVGAAVGLGNIWKFPYVVGTNGGSAFIAVYLLCMLFVAVPVLIAELMVGRLGHHSPPVAMAKVAEEAGASRRWSLLGWAGVIASLMIAPVYLTISGWTLVYIPEALGGFESLDNASGSVAFEQFLANPSLTVWAYSLFLALTMFIIARGLRGGIEATARLVMPALLLLLLSLTAYACLQGDLQRSLDFLFAADFSEVTPTIVTAAIGQAFFSIGLGAGLMMTYGSYLPRRVSIVRSALIIVSADTLVALLAGLMIFPLVFAQGLDPADGPGLIFVTLPAVFSSMQGGTVFGALFFVLLAAAALTSAIAAIEPSISYSEDRWGTPRWLSCSVMGVLLWIVGLLAVLSFNVLGDFAPLGYFDSFRGMTIFDLLDYFTTGILLPLAGLLLSLFVGWQLPRLIPDRELDFSPPWLGGLWYMLIRYVAPLGIAALFLSAWL